MLTIGDCREWATTLAPGSVQCVVTSPPYFGLRDYGTATWEGGDAACDHTRPVGSTRGGPHSTITGGQDTTAHNAQYRGTCGKCGALRVDKQMGLESTPDEFVANLVALFRALRPALRDDGTLWLNLGDSYAGGGGGNYGGTSKSTATHDGHLTNIRNRDAWLRNADLKEKDLIGIPWLVAFALRADGWYLRSDIVWAKRNCMPESVRDRPTRSHEFIFLFSKRPTYYYDADAIREGDEVYTRKASKPHQWAEFNATAAAFDRDITTVGRNKRDVWTVATQPYPDAHFATFPPALIRPCILAGTSAKGACVACGAPWRRVVERPKAPDELRNRGNGAKMDFHTRQTGSGQKLQDWYDANPAQTVGWEPSCQCGTTETRPCVVADPFMGSGTVAQVAVEESRAWVGCDLDARAREWTRARLDGRQVRLDLALGAG